MINYPIPENYIILFLSYTFLCVKLWLRINNFGICKTRDFCGTFSNSKTHQNEPKELTLRIILLR